MYAFRADLLALDKRCALLWRRPPLPSQLSCMAYGSLCRGEALYISLCLVIVLADVILAHLMLLSHGCAEATQTWPGDSSEPYDLSVSHVEETPLFPAV